MPDQFGPATIDKVLREAVQACIECANNERTVFNTVKDGVGKIVITGSSSDFITARNSSCGKVMFLHLSVSHSVHKGGVCPGGGVCRGGV